MKTTVHSALGLLLALSCLSVVALAHPKGDTVKVKGEVVDLWCFLESGARGADLDVAPDPLVF